MNTILDDIAPTPDQDAIRAQFLLRWEMDISKEASQVLSTQSKEFQNLLKIMCYQFYVGGMLDKGKIYG